MCIQYINYINYIKLRIYNPDMSGLKNAYYVYPRTDSDPHPNRLPLKKDLSRPITKQLCNANSTSVGLTCKSSSDRFTGWLLTFIGVSLYWINIYI